jgi:hypothetical protein
LADVFCQGLWGILFTEIRQQEQRPRQTLFAGVEQLIDQVFLDKRAELEAAQTSLDAALRAWDESVGDLWRTSLVLTHAQKRQHALMSFCAARLKQRRNSCVDLSVLGPPHRLVVGTQNMSFAQI